MNCPTCHHQRASRCHVVPFWTATHDDERVIDPPVVTDTDGCALHCTSAEWMALRAWVLRLAALSFMAGILTVNSEQCLYMGQAAGGFFGWVA